MGGLSIIKMFIKFCFFYNRISNEDNKKTKFYRWAIKAFDNSDLMNPGGKYSCAPKKKFEKSFKRVNQICYHEKKYTFVFSVVCNDIFGGGGGTLHKIEN